MNIIDLSRLNINIKQGINLLQQEGNIVYEYNPLRVFRINEDITHEVDGKKIVDYPKGSLMDLDVSDSLLKFDLNHPLEITPLLSYDGSVNLIITDGDHSPLLINSRFSTTGMDTYQIVDRKGDNDTNIYDESTFNVDTSLYKTVTALPKVQYTGLGSGGNMKVGNYVFYFKLADSDGNETDIVAESGIVCCHIGNINDPFSIQGGIEDNNSYKTVNFLLTNIDPAYNYINIYYTRSTSSYDGLEITTAAKIDRLFEVANKTAKISITGFEHTTALSLLEINKQYLVVDSAKTLTRCLNMLFIANVSDLEIAYKELQDLALRIHPKLVLGESVGHLNQNYAESGPNTLEGFEYYNTKNIYYRLGYWDDEIYRFGIVFILNNFTTSPVFNIRGTYKLNLGKSDNSWQSWPIYNSQGVRNYVEVDKTTYDLGLNENAKGVSRLIYGKDRFNNRTIPLAIQMIFQDGVIDELKKHCRGFFFVRLKRIPTTLCQAVTIGLEKQSLLPVIPFRLDLGLTYGTESFIRKNPTTGSTSYKTLFKTEWDGTLTHNISDRWRSISTENVLEGYAAICPEFELKQAYFNQLFTGTEYMVKPSACAFSSRSFTQEGRHLYNFSCSDPLDTMLSNYSIVTVPDGSPGIKNKKLAYKAMAGEPESPYKVSYIGHVNKCDEADNIVRGYWGPYLGLEGRNTISTQRIDIKIPNYSEGDIPNYFRTRYEDASPFYAISERLLWDEIDDNRTSYLYRGDCFICNYTHRMMRNFLDPSAPVNDEIVDDLTWKDHYKVKDPGESNKMNRGDVNAVLLGHWVTFKICSNLNLSMRSVDTQYPIEMGLTGGARGFYPLKGMSATGESKIPESFIINLGTCSTTSDRYNYEMPDVPAIKTKFHTRIIYSDIAVNDAFKNGFRVFKSTHFNDYPLTYGAITKIVDWQSYLICVFEHGVALIPVNERAVAMEAAGGMAYINTHNVLPDNPKILSDTFGSQWLESIIKTPYYVYGVDTVGKKIWRTNGLTLETISDFKILKFLNDNITLSENEKKPTIGIRNVKTHYNQFKHDVMFTFYDDVNTLEENVWNICYNEVMNKWTTFYSWVPSYSANIDNIFFTFDRDCSKTLARLTSNYPLIGMKLPIIKSKSSELGTLLLNMDTGGLVPHFYIDEDCVKGRFTITGNKIFTTATTVDHWEIPIRVELCTKDWTANAGSTGVERVLYSTVGVATEEFYNKQTTSFWKHGLSGLMLMKTEIKPTHWYGKQHPFEFEFVVAKTPLYLKIFNSLLIISNKALPESFHFEVVGETYEFADDKKNMFFRQEALKHLYLYNGSDITYDSNYLTLTPEQRDMPFSTSSYKDRSTMFPISYSRVDSLNTIEDHYLTIEKENHHYQYVSGSEIKYDKQLNEFRIATHIKCCPFGLRYLLRISLQKYIALKELGYGYMTKVIGDKYYLAMTYGRITGNSEYKEDKWWVLIPPISYWQKNELEWSTGYPTLNLVNNPLPESISRLTIKDDNNIPKALRDRGYSLNNTDCFETSRWGSRKETRIRDKYCKIKVRYSGTDLAVITAINTLYTISYA